MSLDQLLAWLPPGSPEEALARQVNFEQLPAHVAIIMDGNGRWAAQRHLPRVGATAPASTSVRDVVEDLGPARHRGAHALRVLGRELEAARRRGQHAHGAAQALPAARARARCCKNNIRFRVIGRPQELRHDIQDELADAVERTPSNTGLLFNIALNYGGRAEIVDAARRADRGGHRAATSSTSSGSAISSTPPASPIPTC